MLYNNNTPSLHDALPISQHSGASGPAQDVHARHVRNRELLSLETTVEKYVSHVGADFVSSPHLEWRAACAGFAESQAAKRSEEHTSELQSRFDIVCRLLL